MIATTITMAFAMIAGAHESWVTANETARYEQLAAIQEAREQEATEDYGEWTGYEEYWEPYYEPTYYYYEPTYCAPSYEQTGDAPDLRSAGVVYDNGTRFTWYSENALPGYGLTELNSNGRHVDERGFVVDADGYIAVASGGHAKGEVVSTPYGEGKVYDYCETPGTVDIYTSF